MLKTDFIENIPLQRVGTREDVANTVLYIVSDAARLLTGTTVIVDGGSWLTSENSMNKIKRFMELHSKLQCFYQSAKLHIQYKRSAILQSVIFWTFSAHVLVISDRPYVVIGSIIYPHSTMTQVKYRQCIKLLGTMKFFCI